jgi:hypothetical protein
MQNGFRLADRRMTMNEIEARGKIKYRIANEMRKYGENKEEYEDLEIALQALKEIREYRELGTVEELKAYKLGDCMNDCEHYDNCSNYIYLKGYNKAIDEFVYKISQEFMRNDEDGNLYIYLWIDEFKKIAEKMKGGAE